MAVGMPTDNARAARLLALVVAVIPCGFAHLAAAATPGAKALPGTAASDKPSASTPQRPAGDQTATDRGVDPPAAATTTDRLTAVTATLLLKVVHPEEVRRAAIEKTKGFGGFASLVTDHELHLRVPPEHLPALLESLTAAGTLLQKSLQRRDRTEAIAQLEARLRSKREIFVRLRAFLDDSNVSATLQIERSMTRLVAELESLKGDLEVERAAVRQAQIVIGFDFHREGRISYVHSPFEWLNTVDLGRFLDAF